MIKHVYELRMYRSLPTVRCESQLTFYVLAISGPDAAERACRHLPGWSVEKVIGEKK